VVAVSLTALLSRGMHLDGLADTADGLSSSLDRDRALQVMRRGDTGPNGAAALVLGLLLQVACLGTLLASVTGATLAATALVASRLAPAIACRRGVPPARPSGLGRTVAGTVAGWGLVVAVTAVALISVPAVQLTASRSPWYAVALAPALVVASGCGVAWFLVNRATARLGGVTGDVIGAAIETALAAALVVGTVCVGVLTP
jgi:adenosylcobinamide-GDP ribazoletransferase